MKTLSIILLLLGCVNCWSSDAPSVQTSCGGVKGHFMKSWGGRQYAAFEGIPYAQPPLGELRFQPPKSVQGWDGMLSATIKGSACTQYVMSLRPNSDTVIGCEDCLYLNIYAPCRNASAKLAPVMFWIHGGVFQDGSGNSVNESRLMDRDIVLVTFNYRVGPLGFLSTGDGVVPGNMGLKDQTMALQWVTNNIQNFGGDPKSVTLFGIDAGAASVHYHYLSPLSAGLFQRGISISGVALDPWSQTERAPEKANQLGAVLGCPTKSTAEMIHCLRERPARTISQAVGDFMVKLGRFLCLSYYRVEGGIDFRLGGLMSQTSLKEVLKLDSSFDPKYWMKHPFAPFGPVVEKQADPRPFINRSPIEVISRGEALDVPWITGVMSEDGLYSAAGFAANDTALKELNDNWNVIAPYLLDFNDTIPLSEHSNVAEKIRKHYLGDKEINNDTLLPLIHMIGDRHFGVDFKKAVTLQAKVNKSPVWTYYYSYRALHSVSDLLSGTTRNFGVCHGDDIYLVINSEIGNTTRPEDMEMQQVLLNFLTSFAATGKPGIPKGVWDTFNPDEKTFRYMHIMDPEHVTVDNDDNFAQEEFWKTIPFEENQPPRNIRER